MGRSHQTNSRRAERPQAQPIREPKESQKTKASSVNAAPAVETRWLSRAHSETSWAAWLLEPMGRPSD